MITASEFFGQFLSYEKLLDIFPGVVVNIPSPYEYQYMYGLTSENKLIAIPTKEIEAKYIQYLEYHKIDMSKLATYYPTPGIKNLNYDNINIEDVKIGSIIKE